jgi:hypothetical protein
VLLELAELEAAGGQPEAALPLLERAVTIVEAAEVPGIERGRALLALGRALEQQGNSRPRGAALVARAHDLAEQAGASGAELRAEIAAWRAEQPAPP